MLTYTYDQRIISIQEKANEADIEFQIELLGDNKLDAKLKDIQHEFEENAVLTDVLFYVYPNHKYHIIVRQDFYNDFILALMKHRLLLRVEWK
ncbi:hypothetical protein [Paenibacillus rhizophilus]|uniref:Uncharacterized protein n=1 Tax=Paenibacillus rhizophilus TaxID=1850366 RepID=A0A3N9NWY2_9BACL|nr:hypothetical protein [Paenibacillus rhizophilus]RQW07899.1 hypothetical protein EH198_23840 [Paenibacillus rhizophilus]